jgi:hypothetical protein
MIAVDGQVVVAHLAPAELLETRLNARVETILGADTRASHRDCHTRCGTIHRCWTLRQTHRPPPRVAALRTWLTGQLDPSPPCYPADPTAAPPGSEMTGTDLPLALCAGGQSLVSVERVDGGGRRSRTRAACRVIARRPRPSTGRTSNQPAYVEEDDGAIS